MACNLDLYQQPELLGSARRTMESLERQLKIVEALEHARDRLELSTRPESTKGLASRSLDKCNVFVSHINERRLDHLEVSKLSLDELAFSSIAFDDRRLRAIAPSFKANNIRKYMKSRRVSATERKDIFKRLDYLSRKPGPFSSIYKAAQNQQVKDEDMPDTLAAEPGSFDFSTASHTHIPAAFGEEVAAILPKRHSTFSSCIRSRYPRSGGDAMHLITLESEPSWLQAMFPGEGNHGCVMEIKKILNSHAVEAIERSDLRQWEVRNGFTDRTNCVKLVYMLKLRTTHEDKIANILHSDAISAPSNDC